MVGLEKDSMMRYFAAFLVLLSLSLSSCCPCMNEPPPVVYFDAHSHTSGILPYQFFADPAAFVNDPGNAGAIPEERRRLLWDSLIHDTKITCNPDLQPKPGEKACNARIVKGVKLTVKAYIAKKLTAQQVDALLERLLTATPFTEFDSAYAVRGVAQEDYLASLYKERYPGETDDQRSARIDDNVCDATILQLALTGTGYSEQFMSFVNGWDADKIFTIRCFIHERKGMAERLKKLNKAAPTVRVLLMTHTSELGTTSDNHEWLQYGKTGRCEKSSGPLIVGAEVVHNALLGKGKNGEDLLAPGELKDFMNGVIGIDTAGPEITCFTGPESADAQGAGMNDYKHLVRSVYMAARERRAANWHGKLLIHTHVGEGGTTYQWPKDSKTLNPFATFPPVHMNGDNEPVHVIQARKNIKMLIQAISEMKSEIKDLDDFIVFRFGHVTHADVSDAWAMKALGIEADVNLASNVATRAYYSKDFADELKKPLTEEEQLKFSDPVAGFLKGVNSNRILAEHPLKHLLEAGVVTMLGSDGAGVEHSDIEHEYSRASDLIEYWNSRDCDFRRLGLSIDTIRKNAQSHLKNMQQDTKLM